MLAEGDDARLLWYMNHAHGSGPAYNVVTITGVRDGAAWERLDAAASAPATCASGCTSVDACRHDVTAKVMLPVHWSPIQEVDFADVPTDGREHELHLFMEDTGWPTSSLDEYIQAWDDIYRKPILAYADDMRAIPIDIQACFQNAHGSAVRREAMLWQWIPDPATVDAPHRHRPAARAARAGHLHVRRARVPRPVAQPAAPDRGLVTALLSTTTCATSADDRPTCSSYVPGSTRHPWPHAGPSTRTRARRA